MTGLTAGAVTQRINNDGDIHPPISVECILPGLDTAAGLVQFRAYACCEEQGRILQEDRRRLLRLVPLQRSGETSTQAQAPVFPLSLLLLRS